MVTLLSSVISSSHRMRNIICKVISLALAIVFFEGFVVWLPGLFLILLPILFFSNTLPRTLTEMKQFLWTALNMCRWIYQRWNRAYSFQGRNRLEPDPNAMLLCAINWRPNRVRLKRSPRPKSPSASFPPLVIYFLNLLYACSVRMHKWTTEIPGRVVSHLSFPHS